jgi:branched-subunit amino acid aminotransferase/4-amino-4-deoxychorismate lyase
MTGRLPHLIETVRVWNGRAPLWRFHHSRLEASAAALGLRPAHLTEPSGPDRVIRILAGNGDAAIEERLPGPAGPLPVAFAGVPHPGYPHKTDRREAFTRALAEVAVDGASEAILSTAEGWVAEGSFTAVLWWEGERIAAPPFALGILPSVARRRIEEIAGPIAEIRIDPIGLAARSFFLANAARGIVEVAALQGESMRRDARTAALAGRFWP